MNITWPGSIATLLLVSLLATGCRSTPATPSLQRFEFTEPQMGTLFSITLYASDEPTAVQASQAAFQRVAELNRVMSDYDPQSELMQLCGKPVGVAVHVSEDLLEILLRSQEISQLSNGAFDVTVGPYVRLWRTARKNKMLPTADEVAAAAQSVGYQKIRLDSRARTVTLRAPGIQLDLGGIAKGYAADKALAVLRRHGINRAMVAASGDIALGDPPPGRQGWGVGIASIDSTNHGLTTTVRLSNAAVSTSGDTEQFVEINGIRYSHIVNPVSGRGLTERIGVTVIARNATTTDGLATAVSVMGAKRGLQLINSLPGVSGVIVTLDNDGKKVIESRKFKNVPRVELRPGTQ
jgi:thiamine biosynthesis lipoprotein